MTGWIAEHAGILKAEPADLPVQREDEEPKRAAEKQITGLLAGEVLLGSVQLISPVSKRQRNTLVAHNPYIASTTIDLTQVDSPSEMKLHYYAAAQMRSLREKKRMEKIQLEGEAAFGGALTLEFPIPGLMAGNYYLDIAVLVAPEGSSNPAEDGLGAMTEGIMIRVQPEELITTGESAI